MIKKTRWLLVLVCILPVWGQGRKPEEPPKKESHPAKSAKEGANDALNSVDQGVHQALHAAKDGANQALDAVDKGVHKVVGSDENK